MPNKYQLVFLATLFSVFFSLVFVSRYINSLLLAAGYDISRIILIGLPDNTEPASQPPPQPTMSAPSFNLRAVDLPVLGTVDVVALTSSPAFLVSAVVIFAAALYTTVLPPKGRTKALNPDAWQEYPLAKKIQISPNTAVYRFSLPHPQAVLGLPIGQHISINAEINGKSITRSYTPVSSDDDRGYFDLLIKSYEQGNISKHVSLLKVGDKIRVKGPKGQFQYSVGLVGHLSMIAGGTGITPMIQVIRAVLKNPSDQTTISLIYANVNHEDILLKKELDELVLAHNARFKIYYVLNNAPAGWRGGVGFVTKDHIKEYHPNPAETNSKLLICGPPPMVTAMKKNLEDLGYPAPRTISKLVDQIFVF